MIFPGEIESENIRAQLTTPAFQIEVRALLEKIDGDKYTDSRVEVTSDGGPIYNFNMTRRSWIEFKVGKTVAYRQPLVGYYFAEYRTGHTKGPIATLKGFRNNEAFFDFLRWAEPTLGSDTEILQPVTLLRMTYNDALKQESLNYALLSGGSVTHLSEDDGTKLWDRSAKPDPMSTSMCSRARSKKLPTSAPTTPTSSRPAMAAR